MAWFPLHCHSHDSLQHGLPKPEQIVSRINECGYAGAALTDHGTVAGCPAFAKAMKKKGKKAILGCEFYVTALDATIKTQENPNAQLCVLAKNLNGWKNLVRAVSASNRPDVFFRKPRLDLPKLAGFVSRDCIVMSGYIGSDLANACFNQPKHAYDISSYAEARTLVRSDWKENVLRWINRYQTLFGKENFYLAIELADTNILPASDVVARILRHCAKLAGVPCVAAANSHYCRKEDAADQRVLLCNAIDANLKEAQNKLANHEEVGLGVFFRSNNYHIPSLEEMDGRYSQEEMQASVDIAAMCEEYDLSSPPLLPIFDCPGGLSPNEYLTKLCRQGWDKKVVPILKTSKEKKAEYAERVKSELRVLTEYNLASYFLVVADYIRFAKEQLKCLVGLGRGSAAGCLVSHLTGITNVDPIRFGLLFERFLNAGRLSKERVSLPDVDTDFPKYEREKVIDYIRKKYGEKRVAQMATFGRMQGRGAIKDVLRAHNRCSFEEMNIITAPIPDEAAIADDLQEMFEETGESSIIRWALENHGDKLQDWCSINEKGELEGPLALDFAQAIRLEGTKRSQGKHASGLIITSVDLSEIVPMVYDKKSEQMIVGLDMKDSESMGLIKFDILGTTVLDKLQLAAQYINTGTF